MTDKKLRNNYLSENFNFTLKFTLKDTSPPNYSISHLQQILLPALLQLEYVDQSPRYHPEGDALYHSLQVFDQALRETDDPELLAVALFHDIGKAVDMPRHDEVGAEMLHGLVPERVVWLVAHHLDLLKHPVRTRKRYAGTAQLKDLEKVRRWDLGGRCIEVDVTAPEVALDHVLSTLFSHQ